MEATMMWRSMLIAAATGIAVLAGLSGALAWDPLAVTDDPLVRMPGTQPEQGVSLEAPNRCLNCHAGFNSSVEPGFNWQGSMMAHAARDFLFWSAMTATVQDSIWAVGRPNATDICLRCHFPAGWLGGRSDPTNASAMTGADFDGVSCDFCHRMYDPFFEDTHAGIREGNDPAYWDETNASDTPSQPAADATYAEDATVADDDHRFSGSDFFGTDNRPDSPGYTESTSGQYFVSPGSQKRASFADAAARHQMLYSRFHKSKYFCATCHDVSNPVLANLDFDGTPPNDGVTLLPTEENPGYAYYHAERTFSEFMLSDYGQQGGAPGIGPFAPEAYQTSLANNWISKCQDCHMRDVVGRGANKKGVPIRPDDSVEHPESGQPLHDLTGGNAWVSWVLASAVPGSPNHDPVNEALLGQGPAALTLDLAAGQGINPEALLAGSERAKQQLELAATIENIAYSAGSGALSFRIQNQTGHKLISGFPEGRRMFINIKAYAGGNLIQEVNPYDATVGTLKGLPHCTGTNPDAVPLGPDEIYVDELVYEMHPKSDLTGECETFHFALATGRYKDNRIPPKGFRIAGAADRLAEPVWHGVSAPNHFTGPEYAGGYDDVSLTIGTGADYVEVSLYYQTTSREYIAFLSNEITAADETRTTLSSPTPSGEANAYIAQTDPFFDRLRAWGTTIWQLWDHNKTVPGAAPFLMAQATVGAAPQCTAPVPELLSATPGNQQVDLAWSDEHTVDPDVLGYSLYYDQAGKAQLVSELGLLTTYTDSGLTNGQEYCYKVTSEHAACVSGFGNILCAVPNNQGQAQFSVDTVETGRYEKQGKGKNQTITFVPTSSFNLGDAVVIRAQVIDKSENRPVADAVVTFAVAGPESTTLTTAPSDANGLAEAQWETSRPNKKGIGGTTPGGYTASTDDVAGPAGYTWDGITASTSFTLQ
jgi:hypothetical protein